MDTPIRLLWGDYTAMGLYMVVVILIGVWFSRTERTSADYLLGGRNMPWLAVGISCLMSLLSTYSLVMVPGEIFNHGLSMWMLHLLGPLTAIGAFLLFTRFYFRLRSFTPFEYLERRYDRSVRMLMSLVVLYTRAIWLAMVLFSTAKVFEGGAGWPAWFTILLVGTIGILYTAMGGMKAVIWSDVLQGGVLYIGMGIAVVVLIRNVDGGAWGAISYALDHGRGPTRFADPDFYSINPYVRLTFWLMLLGAITGPLTTASSDQVHIQRLLSTKSYKDAFRAQIVSVCFGFPFTLILWFIGLAIFSYYAQNPDPRVTAGDTAFFNFVSTRLPTPIPGLIMAAMLSAVMSSLDSGINSLSAIWVKDFHLLFVNKTLDERGQVRLSRIVTVVIGLCAMAFGITISLSSQRLGHSVVEAATIFYAFGAALLPAYLFAVLSRRSTALTIWVLTTLGAGMKFGVTVWHVVTRDVAQRWQEGDPLGLAGPISFSWVWIPGLLFLIMVAYWIWKRHADGRRHVPWLGVSLVPGGFALGTLTWYLCSHFVPWQGPKAVSFQWLGLPGTIVIWTLGVVMVLMSKPAPRHKWQGLTMNSLKEPLLDPPADSTRT